MSKEGLSGVQLDGGISELSSDIQVSYNFAEGNMGTQIISYLMNISIPNPTIQLCCLFLTLLPFGLYAQGERSDVSTPGQTTERIASPRAELSGLIIDSEKKKILVLGTPHLRTIKENFNRTALDSLLLILQSYQPQVIAIESMSPEMIGFLECEGGNSSVILNAFAEKHLKCGHAMQRMLNISRRDAQTTAYSFQIVSDNLEISARLKLVAYLLAAYDYYSALLQWSYLPTDIRKHNDVIPDSISAALTNDLETVNEITALALPLAKNLGHQRVFSIDDHYDDLMLVPISECLYDELQKHPLFQEIVQSRLYRDSDSLLKEANMKGDLLPYYLYLNSPAYLSVDVKTQWGFFFRTRLQSGFDRYRFTLWEIRNMNIASNILKVAALPTHSTVLVIIGAAHKPFLDEYLGQMPDVKLLQLRDILK